MLKYMLKAQWYILCFIIGMICGTIYWMDQMRDFGKKSLERFHDQNMILDEKENRINQLEIELQKTK